MNGNIEKLLAEKYNIRTERLMSSNPLCQGAITLNEKPDYAPFPAYLPLHLFDNVAMDSRTPEEWMATGQKDGNFAPIEAEGLLPIHDDLRRMYLDQKKKNYYDIQLYKKKSVSYRTKFKYCFIHIDMTIRTLMYHHFCINN